MIQLEKIALDQNIIVWSISHAMVTAGVGKKVNDKMLMKKMLKLTAYGTM